MREAENRVRIEGILSENGLEYGSYVKDGRTVECIRGNIKVRVNQNINGESITSEIIVNVFSPKLTNKGTPNPSYTNLSDAKENLVSIAAAGNEDMADRIRITGAKITMNEFYNQNGQLISTPRITASFINKIRKDECKPEATFTAEMYIAEQDYEVDQNGEPTGKYFIRGIIPGYHAPGAPDHIEIVKFVCANDNVVNAVKDYWQNGCTVKASGRLNFSARTESVMEEQSFGEPIAHTRTVYTNDIVITGGSQIPLEGELEYSENDIRKAIADRKVKLDAQKEKDMSRKKMAPAPSTSSSKGMLDLGF